jgi:DNA-directed RNA polymerase subunit RPC12/RpoP
MADMAFTCASCGAQLEYAAGTQAMKCPYCGHENPIVASPWSTVAEIDYATGLAEAEQSAPTETVSVVSCKRCAAAFQLDPAIQASRCPFCGTPIVLESRAVTHLRPGAVLPFGFDAKAARAKYEAWLSGLWFAPNDVKRLAKADNGFIGMYVPYWTYDAATQSDYTGQRGITIVRTVRDGNQTWTVTETRWTPCSGRVARDFDDVTVVASRSLPEGYLDRLEPWDLGALVPYDERYLRGFGAQHYQVGLADGFDTAKAKMESVIRGDVRSDIGGDQQIINALQTDYAAVTFKHVLLPVWLNSFRYGGKAYSFVINGRTGKVQGQRPWSWVKIGLAVLAVLVLAVLFMSLYGER